MSYYLWNGTHISCNSISCTPHRLSLIPSCLPPVLPALFWDRVHIAQVTLYSRGWSWSLGPPAVLLRYWHQSVHLPWWSVFLSHVVTALSWDSYSCSQAATTNCQIFCYYKTTAASHDFDIFYPSLDLMKFKPNLNIPPALNPSAAQYPPGPKQRFYFWNLSGLICVRQAVCHELYALLTSNPATWKWSLHLFTYVNYITSCL